ncbi:MAG: hypothetical protein ACI9SP_002719 [Arenicella sp.]|jgi:hypothetical protein
MISDFKKQFAAQSAKFIIPGIWTIASIVYFFFEKKLTIIIGDSSDLLLLRTSLFFFFLSLGLILYLYLNKVALKFDPESAIYFDKHEVPHCPSCFSQDKRIAPMKTRESDWLCLNKNCKRLYSFPGEEPKKKRPYRRY